MKKIPLIVGMKNLTGHYSYLELIIHEKLTTKDCFDTNLVKLGNARKYEYQWSILEDTFSYKYSTDRKVFVILLPNELSPTIFITHHSSSKYS